MRIVLSASLLSACAGGGSPVALPPPTGPYAVGFVELQSFYTSAWYPAEASTGLGPRPWAGTAALALAELTASDLGPISGTASFAATPTADGPHPVVVFGPGGSSAVDYSQVLFQELASHGYLVVAVQPDPFREGGELAGTLAPDEDLAAQLEDVAVRARRDQVAAAIDLLEDPLTAELVGEPDLERIAIGGHSYGGSTAFNVAIADPRVDAAFDLDGMLFEEAGTTPTPVPSLMVLASMMTIEDLAAELGDPLPPDVQLALDTVAFLPTAENTVSVGLIGAEHYDVTDLPVILPALPAALRRGADGALVGPIGPDGTTDTATIVLRFLDAALAGEAVDPAELVAGLPSATATPLSGGRR